MIDHRIDYGVQPARSSLRRILLLVAILAAGCGIALLAVRMFKIDTFKNTGVVNSPTMRQLKMPAK